MATEEEIRELIMQFPAGHPLRRNVSGPSDIEWALLAQKVTNMEVAIGELTKEVKKYNELSVARCASCNNTRFVEDHERRIRGVEQMMWKAMGIAAAVAGLLSFVLDKIFK
jgi:hypothetical protein